MRFTIASSILVAAALANASVLSKRADCQAQANACRTAPDANQSFCSAQLSSCLGYNPYANNTAPANTTAPANATTQDPKSACEAADNKCRTAPYANQATCSAQLAACLGYNPYEEPTPVWVTEVVTKFTTYCPEATTLTYNEHTYVASKGEYLTVTDCPCTITKPVGEAPEPTPYPTEECTGKDTPCPAAPKPAPYQADCSAKDSPCPAGPAYPEATAPAGPAPKPETPAGSHPEIPAPAGNAPVPAGNAPAGNAPAGHSPADNVPAGNVPAGNGYNGPIAGALGAPAGPVTPAQYTGVAVLNKPYSSLFAMCVAALVIV